MVGHNRPDNEYAYGRAPNGNAMDKSQPAQAQPAQARQPQFIITELPARLWRELGLMALVFFVLFGIGAYIAFQLPKSYTANASLLMQLGQDYVYIPRAGDAGRGAVPSIDLVVQSEVEILQSNDLKQRVVDKLGYEVILPRDHKLWNPRTPSQKLKSDQAATKVLTTGLEVGTTPDLGVVRLGFKHQKAQTAALILNSLIGEYQKYRLEVLSDRLGPGLEKEKLNFDARLAETDLAYQSFLRQNGVADFVTAKAAFSKLYDLALAENYTIDETLAQNQGKLAAVTQRLKSLSPEMSLQRDLDLSIPTKILALRQQRQDLLSRYLPSAPPVTDIDAQIASLQSLMNMGSGIGEKEHKLGTNPIYTDLTTQKLNLESEIAALNARRKQAQVQSEDIARKLQNLLALEAEYNRLTATRDSLQSNIKTFTQRIQENEAADAIAKQGDQTVRVVGLATPPDKGSSMKLPVLVLSLLFALMSALCLGLLRSYTRKGFGNASMAQSQLGLPILAQAGRK